MKIKISLDKSYSISSLLKTKIADLNYRQMIKLIHLKKIREILKRLYKKKTNEW